MAPSIELAGDGFLRIEQTEAGAADIAFAAALGFSGTLTVGIDVAALADVLEAVASGLQPQTASVGTDCEFTMEFEPDRLGHVAVRVHYCEWTRLGDLVTRFAFVTDQTYLQQAAAQLRSWGS